MDNEDKKRYERYREHMTEEERAKADKAEAIVNEVLQLLKSNNLTIVDARRILNSAVHLLEMTAFSVPIRIPEDVKWSTRRVYPDFTSLDGSPRQ